jgi:general secretion pathway protein K
VQAVTPEMPGIGELRTNESGFALILSIFVVALMSIIVLDFAKETIAFQQQSRAFTEKLQGDFILKSTLNVARLLLELPKLQVEDGEVKTVREDWLGEPWSLVSSLPSLPLPGSPRLSIVDESGKFDINSIVEADQGTGTDGAAAQTGGSDINNLELWKSVVANLFRISGFENEEFPEEEHRTFGNRSYAADQQVAAIHDWIDSDKRSFSSAGFPGEGVESSLPKEWFYNRPMYSVNELAMVPGMTLERVARVAPFLRASVATSFSATRVNVNTAPRAVLLALEFPETQVLEIEQVRLSAPISAGDLQTLIQGDQRLVRLVGVESRSFSAYASVELANTTRWAKAIFDVQGGGARRRATIRSMQIQ